MKLCLNRIAATMPLTCPDPGASGGWQSSGAAAARALPVHEGTLVPSASVPSASDAGSSRPRTGFVPGMRITSPGSDLYTTELFSNHVPGAHTWNPPA